MFFVYMVRCADGTLYTGLARNPQARAQVHNSGKGAKYTRSRLPVELVYSEPCDSLGAALKRERQLKPWPRARKEALIALACPRSADPRGDSPGATPATHTSRH
jgi:predicted GIY-YIG superfamily endonuclease